MSLLSQNEDQINSSSLTKELTLLCSNEIELVVNPNKKKQKDPSVDMLINWEIEKDKPESTENFKVNLRFFKKGNVNAKQKFNQFKRQVNDILKV